MMLHNGCLEKPVLNRIVDIPLKILELGSGLGEFGFILRSNKQVKCLIALDLHRPYLRKIKEFGLYHHYIKASGSHLPFRDNCFDYSIAMEIIEHMSYRNGYKMLSEMERISKYFILSTPINMIQDKKIHNNPYNIHISFWFPEQFRNYNYNIEIISSNPFPILLKILNKIRIILFRLKTKYYKFMIVDNLVKNF